MITSWVPKEKKCRKRARSPYNCLLEESYSMESSENSNVSKHDSPDHSPGSNAEDSEEKMPWAMSINNVSVNMPQPHQFHFTPADSN